MRNGGTETLSNYVKLCSQWAVEPGFELTEYDSRDTFALNTALIIIRLNIIF